MGHHFNNGPIPGFDALFGDENTQQRIAELERKLDEERRKNAQPIVMEIGADGPKLGATGQFPDGKLSDNDEGEIMIGIAVYRGKVLFNFGKPVQGVGFTPEQAEQIGRDLINKAREAAL
jgi:hypothetical protein